MPWQRGFFHAGPLREVEFSDADIEEVLRRVSGESGENVVVVGEPELSSTHWRLDTHQYVSRVEVEGVPLGSVAEISRGAGVSARELDERITSEHTPWRYLMIRDLGDEGEVAGALPFLKDLRKGEERFLLQDKDIVVGRMPPFKSALVSVPEGESVLCTGNLFVIRPDADEVDPTYLRMFFSSRVGQAQLQDACVGASVRSVPIQGLSTRGDGMTARFPRAISGGHVRCCIRPSAN